MDDARIQGHHLGNGDERQHQERQRRLSLGAAPQHCTPSQRQLPTVPQRLKSPSPMRSSSLQHEQPAEYHNAYPEIMDGAQKLNRAKSKRMYEKSKLGRNASRKEVLQPAPKVIRDFTPAERQDFEVIQRTLLAQKYTFLAFLFGTNLLLIGLVVMINGRTWEAELHLSWFLMIFKLRDLVMIITAIIAAAYIGSKRLLRCIGRIFSKYKPNSGSSSRLVVSVIPCYSETREQVIRTLDSIVNNDWGNHRNVFCLITDGGETRDLHELLDAITDKFTANYRTWRGDKNSMDVTVGVIGDGTPCVILAKHKNAGKKDSLLISHELFNRERPTDISGLIAIRSKINKAINNAFISWSTSGIASIPGTPGMEAASFSAQNYGPFSSPPPSFTAHNWNGPPTRENLEKALPDPFPIDNGAELQIARCLLDTSKSPYAGNGQHSSVGATCDSFCAPSIDSVAEVFSDVSYSADNWVKHFEEQYYWHSSIDDELRFDYVFHTDADSIIETGSILAMIKRMDRMPNCIGCAGLVVIDFIENSTGIWNTFQAYQYLFGQIVRRQGESRIKRVVCLPGCITLLRCSEDTMRGMSTYGVPPPSNHLFLSQIQLLGTDRRLTSLILYQGAQLQTVMEPRAVCRTIPPQDFASYKRQRRRWGSNSMFNGAYNIFARHPQPVLRIFGFADVARMCFVYLRIFAFLFFIYLMCQWDTRRWRDTKWLLLRFLPAIVAGLLPTIYFFLALPFYPRVRGELPRLLVGFFVNKVMTYFLSVAVITTVVLSLGNHAWGKSVRKKEVEDCQRVEKDMS